jgi:hypothetical protein
LGHEGRRLGPSLYGRGDQEDLPCEVECDPPRVVIDEIWARVRAGPDEEVAGLIDRELFADRCAPAMSDAARGLRDRWHPDVVVREPCEYASAVAACEAGIAQVQIGVSQTSIEWEVLEMVSPIIEHSVRGRPRDHASAVPGRVGRVDLSCLPVGVVRELPG